MVRVKWHFNWNRNTSNMFTGVYRKLGSIATYDAALWEMAYRNVKETYS